MSEQDVDRAQKNIKLCLTILVPTIVFIASMGSLFAKVDAFGEKINNLSEQCKNNSQQLQIISREVGYMRGKMESINSKSKD